VPEERDGSGRRGEAGNGGVGADRDIGVGVEGRDLDDFEIRDVDLAERDRASGKKNLSLDVVRFRAGRG
jgi:hypothetical protein